MTATTITIKSRRFGVVEFSTPANDTPGSLFVNAPSINHGRKTRCLSGGYTLGDPCTTTPATTTAATLESAARKWLKQYTAARRRFERSA